MDNIRTILCDLPLNIGGYTIRKDDFYTIVLNQNLSYDRNMESYQHEIDHIAKGDFDSGIDVGILEFFAHNR